MPDDKRLYSEQEISAILKRAGEMQAEGGTGDVQGLSLQDLQQVAAEVGLDPRLVEAAALEMERAGMAADGLSLLGAPVTLHLERVYDGEASPAQWAEMVQAMTEAFGVIGTSAQVGRTLEWTYTSRKKQLQVTLTPAGGQTRVRVSGNFKKTAVLFFLPGLIMAAAYSFIIPLGIGVPLLGAAGIALAAVMLVYLVARFGYGAYMDKRERDARRLMAALETLIVPAAASEKGSAEVVAPALAIEEAPIELLPGDPARRIDLEAAPEAESTPRRRRRGRRRP